jgi:hypothetical protein
VADTKISALTAVTAPVTTDELVIVDGGATKKITAANLAKAMPGYELDYVALSADVTTTQTTRASADTAITGNSVTYDGSTVVMVEVFVPRLGNNTSAGGINMTLWEDSTDLGIIGGFTNDGSFGAGPGGTGASVRMRRTPSAAAHIYTLRIYVSIASTGTVFSSTAGTPATRCPAFMRITRV